MSRQLYGGNSRMSYAPRPTTAGPAAEPMKARLQEKCQEHVAFGQIADQSKQLADYLQELNEKTDVLLEGGQGSGDDAMTTCNDFNIAEHSLLLTAVEKVVENWQNVFRAVQIAAGERTDLAQPNERKLIEAPPHCSISNIQDGSKPRPCRRVITSRPTRAHPDTHE
jgi:hypothetical protein